jgi:hypothetical protein
MDNCMYDELDRLQRIVDGKPPRKEITLSPDCMMTEAEVAEHTQRMLDAAIKKHGRVSGP